jgi:hypothetical protein
MLPITIPATPAIIAKSKNFFLSNVFLLNYLATKDPTLKLVSSQRVQD